MKVLITGASGGLGRRVYRALVDKAEVLAPPRAALDVAIPGDVCAFVGKAKPDVVVHLAALTDTALCERRPDLAAEVNTLGTARVVRASRMVGARVVYMSTDAVFSGAGPHEVEKPPAPSTAYGRSKLAGEQVLDSQDLIVRANFFTTHCTGKRSFASYVVREALGGRVFSCYTDTTSTPVYAGALARRIADAVLGEWRGILHVASADAVDRVRQAEMICREFRLPASGISAVAGPVAYDGRLAPSDGGMCGTVLEGVKEMAREESL